MISKHAWLEGRLLIFERASRPPSRIGRMTLAAGLALGGTALKSNLHVLLALSTVTHTHASPGSLLATMMLGHWHAIFSQLQGRGGAGNSSRATPAC